MYQIIVTVYLCIRKILPQIPKINVFSLRGVQYYNVWTQIDVAVLIC